MTTTSRCQPEGGRNPEEAAAAAGRYMAEVKHVVVPST
jgi:hypothetical protein